MRSSNLLPRIALLALAVPVAGFCASLQISSTGGPIVCVNTCPDPNSTSTAAGLSPASGTVSGSFSYTYTLADLDEYVIGASYSASYTTGIAIVFNPTIIYLGNNGNKSTAAVSNDNISLDLYQNFYDPTPNTSWNGTYCETFPSSITAGSTTGALSYDGTSIGTISSGSKCSALTFTTGQNASAYLNADYNVTCTFVAGEAAGSTCSSISAPTSSVPEPSTMALGLLCSGSLLYFVRRRRAASTK